MRVLHITDQMPGYISGGNLGILQFSYAWTRATEYVDYIGPIIEDDAISKWYTNVIFFDRSLTKLQKLKSILLLQFNRNYVCWKKVNIEFDNYDLIYIDSTKMSFALKDIKKSGYSGKIIVRAHNVEADFFKVNFLENRNLINFFKYIVAKPREKYMVNQANKVFAITEADKNRLIELYRIDKNKVLVCPVGVNRINENVSLKHATGPKIKGLITGSMWFGPNASATKWFVENVYPSVSNICSLTVAGFKPNNELKEICRQHGVTIVDSPETMTPFFEEADLFLAPIFDGGGMKVKIAEAMSYALPVITTNHGAIGYEEAKNSIFVANTDKEFIGCIKDYFNLGDSERLVFLQNAWKTYKENYSLDAISNFISTFIEEQDEEK